MSCMPAYTPGIEISGGSIGLGMPIAVGMAMGLKRKGSDSKVYVMMGDGEMAEGPTWEAAMSAGSYGLDNIIGIVDVNGIQADGKTSTVLNTEPLHEKFAAFNYDVQRVNGNSLYPSDGSCGQGTPSPLRRSPISFCATQFPARDCLS